MRRFRQVRRIDRLLRALAAQPDTDRLRNPYQQAAMRRNLRCYFKYFLRQSEIPLLLVGEALGFRGGLLTGIPFSSGKVFQREDHPLLRRVGRQLTLQTIESESTATVAWDCFVELDITPLCWNALPFHPHSPGKPRGNRAPTRAEIASSQHFLQEVYDIFQPQRVVGVGNRGYDCAMAALPDVEVTKVRHPSRGGKQEFISGLRALSK